MIVWAIFARVVVSWHFTWMVDLVTHLWGSRRFDVRDDSRNNAGRRRHIWRGLAQQSPCLSAVGTPWAYGTRGRYQLDPAAYPRKTWSDQ